MASGPVGSDPLPETVARLTEPGLDRRERRQLLGRLVLSLGRSAKAAGVAGVGGGRWLTELVVQTVPRLPIRDLPTLREHHGGLAGDALAAALIRSASLAASGIGAAGGALATAEWAAPPTLLSTPVQIAAETLAVAAVELKLVAELHEVYGVIVPGTRGQRAGSYLTAWAHRRGVDLGTPSAGLTGVVGQATRRELRDQLMRRMGRNLATLGPLFTGAVVGAELNRRATRSLGEAVQRDLRRRGPEIWGGPYFRRPPPQHRWLRRSRSSGGSDGRVLDAGGK